jgi:hypothetical protein
MNAVGPERTKVGLLVIPRAATGRESEGVVAHADADAVGRM